jgi:hypothetical protein
MGTSHLNFVERAKEILRERGFREEEIHEEFWFKNYRVDVVGWSTEKKIAIECGFSSSRKREELKKFFDEVLYLPYEVVIHPKSPEVESLESSNLSSIDRYTGLKLLLMKDNDILFEIPLCMEDWPKDSLKNELTSFETELDQFKKLFDALSHKTRLRMMTHLFEDNNLTLSFADFMRDLDLNPKIVWESTRKLREGGLLTKSPNGKYRCSDPAAAEFLMISLALRRLLKVMEEL